MKIVINSCFGGFGLSSEAVLYLIKRDSLLIKKQHVSKYFGKETEEEVVKEFNKYGKWDTFKDGYLAQHDLSILFKDNYIYDVEIDNAQRNHLDLVEVVEALKEKANGPCAKLKIVDIPKNVKWTIAEYDGNEHVAEKHRTWYAEE